MLAYFDSFAGLVPCRILSVTPHDVRLVVTASRGAYERGTVVETTWRHAVPRGSVWRRKYKTTILPYDLATLWHGFVLESGWEPRPGDIAHDKAPGPFTACTARAKVREAAKAEA